MEKSVSIMRYEDGRSAGPVDDQIAVEEPLEIRVGSRAVTVTMRTPGHDEELAAGFLLSEGIIRDLRDLSNIAPCRLDPGGNVLNVSLAQKTRIDFDRLTRHVFASSSCGLCGKATIESVHQQFPPADSQLQVNADILLALPRKLRSGQTAFDHTGGLHAAGIFNLSGQEVVIREDIGRHNAVDKVLGHGLLADLLPFDRHILMVSGRASFEILQKALAARVPIVAAVSAPSSLAVQFAESSRQTLVGFVRGRRMNVYCHPCRIC